MVHFCELLKNLKLQSNSVTRQVNFKKTKLMENAEIQMWHFSAFQTLWRWLKSSLTYFPTFFAYCVLLKLLKSDKATSSIFCLLPSHRSECFWSLSSMLLLLTTIDSCFQVWATAFRIEADSFFLSSTKQPLLKDFQDYFCSLSSCLKKDELIQRNISHDEEKKKWFKIALKITEKVSFNIASEASYFLSGQKLIKNAKIGQFWRVFENLKLRVKQCYQTGPFQKVKKWWKMPK